MNKIVLHVLFVLLILFAFFWFMWPTTIAKPIIYIYPEKDMNVSIKVNHPDKFTVTYPKYKDGWNVLAKTDGTLIDKNGKKYYALYWEGNNYAREGIKEDGFIVRGEDVSNFLDEKLEILGLNYKEREEFIIYWLPKLEKNKYNYIRFKTMEEINSIMELDIDPEPDSLIRVLMEYKKINKKINIKEQELEHVDRCGYTVVEWGGVEL